MLKEPSRNVVLEKIIHSLIYGAPLFSRYCIFIRVKFRGGVFFGSHRSGVKTNLLAKLRPDMSCGQDRVDSTRRLGNCGLSLRWGIVSMDYSSGAPVLWLCRSISLAPWISASLHFWVLSGIKMTADGGMFPDGRSLIIHPSASLRTGWFDFWIGLFFGRSLLWIWCEKLAAWSSGN